MNMEPAAPSTPPPPRPTPAVRRRRILQTAIRVYAEHGFHQTGMRQLCTALGMSPGALYRYFPGKEAIIAGLVEMDREMVQAQLGQIPRGTGFFDTMRQMTEMVHSQLESSEGLLAIWSEISSEATRNPAVAALLRHHYQFISRTLGERVQAGMDSGELRSDLDPVAAVRFILAMHDGMMTHRAIDPSYPLRQVARDNLVLVAAAFKTRPDAPEGARKLEKHKKKARHKKKKEGRKDS